MGRVVKAQWNEYLRPAAHGASRGGLPDLRARVRYAWRVRPGQRWERFNRIRDGAAFIVGRNQTRALLMETRNEGPTLRPEVAAFLDAAFRLLEAGAAPRDAAHTDDRLDTVLLEQARHVATAVSTLEPSELWELPHLLETALRADRNRTPPFLCADDDLRTHVVRAGDDVGAPLTEMARWLRRFKITDATEVAAWAGTLEWAFEPQAEHSGYFRNGDRSAARRVWNDIIRGLARRDAPRS